MTLVTTDSEQTQLTMLLGLIKRKEDHAKEGKEIDKLFSIYSSELAEAKKKLHRTSAGALVTVHDMDDDHLFNTIAMHVKRNGFNKIPEKYKTEMKGRPAVLARVLEIDQDTKSDTTEWEGGMTDTTSEVGRYYNEIQLRNRGKYSMGSQEFRGLQLRYGSISNDWQY